jgi:hypothetical protein
MIKRLNEILADIPFTFTYLGRKSSLLIFFVPLAAACISAFFLSPSKKLFAFQLPVLLAIGWGGVASIVLAAILAGIWELLREPSGEFFSAHYSKRSAFDYAGSGLMGLLKRLRPYRLNVLLTLLFLAMLFALSISGFFSPISLLAALGGSSLLYALSLRLRAASFRKNMHTQFNPVLLFPFRLKTFSFFPFLFPFVLFSFLVIVLPQFRFADRKERLEPPYFISPIDYSRHLDFQRYFSYRPLHSGYEGFDPDDYLHYHLGDDGLISAYSTAGWDPEDFPFPLEKLMDFLINYHEPAGKNLDKSGVFYPPKKSEVWILASIILILCLLDSLKPRKTYGKRLPVSQEKRIAA